MDEMVSRAQLAIPVGVHRATRQVVTLAAAQAEPGMIAGPAELTAGERMALVRQRWEAGEWFDLMVGHDRVDLARAKAELAAQSDLGRELMRITERAIEMVLEDAGVRRRG